MNHRCNYKHQRGFTLVELSISMAFIAMLLLGIAFLTIQISTIYNKGLTIRAVNESGRLISTDIQRTLNVSRPTDVLFVDVNDTGVAGGRLCANSVVYAWNYAGSLTTGFNRFNRYDGSDSGREVRMIRFIGDASYCRTTGPSGDYKLLPADSESLTELLKSGDNTLALHSFDVQKDSEDKIGQAVKDDDTQRIYQVSFIIGSNDTSHIDATGCEVPASRVDDTYCSVNTFNFTARAGNKGVSDGQDN